VGGGPIRRANRLEELWSDDVEIRHEQIADGIDPLWFRKVLGHYPTGVCVIAALDGRGHPVGMAVGSFVSVSMNPPLVAFFPDRSSSSWPRIAAAGRFCVNVLAADQEAVCRRFASRQTDKFDGVHYRLSPGGSPALDGIVAWIDCTLHGVQEAGDHYIVTGQVQALDIADKRPLLFFQGGYGHFAPLQPEELTS
jgi:flavin reductase (DIM6/NTAB) family NADH-FMN oxidoreductase RutF